MAAQLTLMNGAEARGLCRCSARATSSLPVPLSPGDQDGGLGAGDFADQLAQLLHGLALAQQLVAGIVLLGVVEVVVDLEELVEILRLLERDMQLVGRKGLEHVIKSAVAHAVDGRFHGAETR